MNNRDKKRFSQVIGTLATVFSQETNPFLLQVYFDALRDLTIEQVEAAGARLLQTAKFFPKPVEFREAILGDPNQQAEAALELALANNDPWRSVCFRDPALMVALERSFGSWQNFCHQSEHLDDEAWTWKRKAFVEAYKSAALFQEKPSRPYLPGLTEEGNEKYPEHVRPVLVIERTGASCEVDRKALAPAPRPLAQLLEQAKEQTA